MENRIEEIRNRKGIRKEKFTRLMGDSRQKISPEKLTIIQNRTPITFTHIWEWRMRQLR